MPGVDIRCDHAIFTSVRTPMGEGYRIVSASKGVKADEKQAITRVSPSHESLCVPGQPQAAAPARVVAKPVTPAQPQPTIGPEAPAVSFYPLPGGRLCVSTSCHAGAEHTGRGGQRVFTRAVIFDESEFAKIAFNPLNVVRAMVAAGLTAPDLKPPAILPDLTLQVEDSALHGADAKVDVATADRVLRGVCESRSLLVNLAERWTLLCEAILLATPGPMRSKLSFSAGLRFSTGRSFRLQTFLDEKAAAKAKMAGPASEYVDTYAASPSIGAMGQPIAPSPPAGGAPPSAWFAFVARHWAHGDLAGLSRRTSRAFNDSSATGRERIGRWYALIDELPSRDTAAVLSVAVDQLGSGAAGVEGEIVTELAATAQRVLERRFSDAAWNEIDRLWPALVATWRRSADGTALAGPLIVQGLRSLVRKTPIHAAEAALPVAQPVPAGVDVAAHTALLDEVLERFAKSLESKAGAEPLLGCGPEAEPAATLRRILPEWQRLRPQCAIVKRIAARYDELIGRTPLLTTHT